jgi:hypothetical protein
VRRHVTTLLWAAGLTALSVCGNYALGQYVEPRWLALIAFAPAMPAFFASFLFVSGADGNPADPGVAVFMATFALWAVVIDRIRAWRRQPR